MNKPKAYVFDAYGTLFDVYSVQASCEEVFAGSGEKLTRLWRTKQLEYSWLRSLMGRYEDFWKLTEDGLRYSCQFLGLQADAAQIEKITQSYLTLSAFPETTQVLDRLAGLPRAILSNGTPAMLEAVVRHNRLDGSFDHILSVDELKMYKPHPAVYRLAVDRLGLSKEEIGFISSNGWDVAGAKAFGFKVFWLNRLEAPVEELGVEPDAIIKSPLELLDFT
jgi:2-haloacid dehalogenase